VDINLLGNQVNVLEEPLGELLTILRDDYAKSSSSAEYAGPEGGASAAAAAPAAAATTTAATRTLVSVCGVRPGQDTVDLSNGHIDPDDVILLGAELERNASVTAVNVLGSRRSIRQLAPLVRMRDAGKLRTLCGLTGFETELDLSGRGLSTSDAVILAAELQVL
jgi:hypothetical protein